MKRLLSQDRGLFCNCTIGNPLLMRQFSFFYNYLFSFLLLIFSGLVLADAEMTTEHLTIARSIDDWGPNEFMGIDGKPTGFHIDLIQMAAEQLGVEIEFISMPWKRALKTIEKGEVDAISYTIFSKDRTNYLIYEDGNAISIGSTRFAFLKGKNFHYDGTIESVKDRKIGVIRGYSYGKKFDRNKLTNLVNVNSEEQLLLMLLEKRVDLILVNIDHLKYKYSHLPEFADVASMDIASDSYDIFLAFSKKRGHEKLAKRFAEIIPKIRSSEKYQQIVQSYYLK